jgi:hypothetical protein
MIYVGRKVGMHVYVKVCKFMFMYMSVLREIQKYRSYIVDTDAFINKILKGHYRR